MKRSPVLPRPDVAGGSLFSSASVVLLGNITSRALGFLFPLLLTHTMARRDFALVSFLLSTGWFASQVVLTGFPTALSRELAAERRPELRGSWTVSALLAGVPLVMIAIVAGAVLAAVGDVSPALMALVIVGLSLDAYYFGLCVASGASSCLPPTASSPTSFRSSSSRSRYSSAPSALLLP